MTTDQLSALAARAERNGSLVLADVRLLLREIAMQRPFVDAELSRVRCVTVIEAEDRDGWRRWQG
jgi:hypothetical protein